MRLLSHSVADQRAQYLQVLLGRSWHWENNLPTVFLEHSQEGPC